MEINPGIQFIIRSDMRIDLSMGFPLINQSYNHTYPLYYIGMQPVFLF